MTQNSTNNDIIEVHAIFHGRVQGVGFRAISYHLASQLNLKGSVRNCTDGSVEAYIQGSHKDIHQLFELIHHEIGLENIVKITQREITPLNTYEGFKILR